MRRGLGSCGRQRSVLDFRRARLRGVGAIVRRLGCRRGGRRVYGRVCRERRARFPRQAFAHLRYNYKISPHWTWEAFAPLQTGPLQQLRQPSLLGSGPRWRVFKSAAGRQRVYLGAAWLWEENQFSESDAPQAWHRSSNYVSATLRIGKQSALITTTYWQPVWGLIRNYRLSTEWLLKIALTKKLSFTLDFSYSVDKNLPAGEPKETYAWLNGVSWQL